MYLHFCLSRGSCSLSYYVSWTKRYLYTHVCMHLHCLHFFYLNISLIYIRYAVFLCSLHSFARGVSLKQSLSRHASNKRPTFTGTSRLILFNGNHHCTKFIVTLFNVGFNFQHLPNRIVCLFFVTIVEVYIMHY